MKSDATTAVFVFLDEEQTPFAKRDRNGEAAGHVASTLFWTICKKAAEPTCNLKLVFLNAAGRL